MDKKLHNSEGIRVALVAVLAAFLLAANEITQNGMQGLASSYAYWVIRILIESALFVATLYAVERLLPDRPQRFMLYVSSILISLIPFTLAITSLDLIVGLPELGLNEIRNTATSRLQAFALELLFLLDNHVVLCTLLLLPRLLTSMDSESADLPKDTDIGVSAAKYFYETIEPPLEGHICRIDAQEHYIRITTSKEKRMVLYRFSDAVREMPDSLGMQVHRSHWVAYSAIQTVLKDGQKLQLRLLDEEIVPVSRSFHVQVEERYAVIPGSSAKA